MIKSITSVIPVLKDIYHLLRLQKVYILNCWELKKHFKSRINNPKESVPPHPIRFYQNTLERLKQRGMCSLTMHEYLQHSEKQEFSNVVLRHDVDFSPEKLHLLIDVERNYQMKSSVYVLVRNHHYPIKQYSDYFKELHADGYEIGLHTYCYSFSDAKKCLSEEAEIFKTIFGFYPKTFTFHGMFYRSYEQLMQLSAVLKNLDDFLSDTPFSEYYTQKGFHWKIGDEYRNKVNPFLNNNFNDFKIKTKPGSTGLVLTHPCNWVEKKL